jgi:hypothetical protein
VEWRELGGCRLVLHFAGDGALQDIVRLEESDGGVSRIVDYCYCPDTLEAVAAELGLTGRTMGYHQPPKVLETMIASTQLGWVT